jgi:serine/threonine protein kinase
MTSERWQQIKAVLAQALELEQSRRDEYLAQACGSDRLLREEVERLLLADAMAGERFLEDSALAAEGPLNAEDVADPWVGRRVGSYQIVDALGSGGMGEVFRAVRADDQYRSHVAIKVVRAEHGSGLVIGRFKTERQILADLDHPNIARLIDGGTTSDGMPYFVMELIDGNPIDRYCESRHLSVGERLMLFTAVCAAVQYAHQRLIVHRDLKPTNILVTDAGVPKLLDFGIAKILSPDEGAGPREQTMANAGFLTPRYASPEQIKGETVTTASDVYSLGVILYELLTEQSPYRVATRVPSQLAQAICDVEPERPSTTIRRLGSTPEKRAKRLSGELDNIVLMALRKEPSRRYSSVEQLAEDVRRHLANLPILARKDTLGYRSSKFVVRHKAGVAAALGLAVTLLAGMAATMREARVAREQATLAEARFRDVRQLANSLIFEIHDSIQQLPGATAARQLIVQRAQEYLAGLASSSGSDASLLGELAAAYDRLGNVLGSPLNANVGNSEAALDSYQRAAQLREKAVTLDRSNPERRRQLAEGYLSVALVLEQVGRSADAAAYSDRAVKLLEPLSAARPRDRDVRSSLAKAYGRVGGLRAVANDLSRGTELYQKSLSLFARLADEAPENVSYKREVSFGHKHLAALLSMQQKLREALEHEQAALEIDEAQLALAPENAERQYSITITYSDMGYILGGLGELDSARRYYEKALAIRTAAAAADPKDVRSRQGLAKTYGYIAQIHRQKKELAAALEAHMKALRIRQALAERDPVNEGIRYELALSEFQVGDIYEELAARPKASPDEQRTFCTQARSWLSKSLPVSLAREKQGLLTGDEVSLPVDTKRTLERCDRRLQALSPNYSRRVLPAGALAHGR